MPAQVEHDSALGIVRIRVTGALRVDSARQLVEQVAAAHSDLPRLWDLRESDLTLWTLPLMRAFAKANRGVSGTRAAALVDRDVDYGLARMFEMVNPPGPTIEYKAFRDENEAVRWLRGEAAG